MREGTMAQLQRAREAGLQESMVRRGNGAEVCPVCGDRKVVVRDRMLVRGYVPGQAEQSHLVSCGDCYEEIEREGAQ